MEGSENAPNFAVFQKKKIFGQSRIGVEESQNIKDVMYGRWLPKEGVLHNLWSLENRYVIGGTSAADEGECKQKVGRQVPVRRDVWAQEACSGWNLPTNRPDFLDSTGLFWRVR